MLPAAEPAPELPWCCTACSHADRGMSVTDTAVTAEVGGVAHCACVSDNTTAGTAAAVATDRSEADWSSNRHHSASEAAPAAKFTPVTVSCVKPDTGPRCGVTLCTCTPATYVKVAGGDAPSPKSTPFSVTCTATGPGR